MSWAFQKKYDGFTSRAPSGVKNPETWDLLKKSNFKFPGFLTPDGALLVN